MFYVKDPPIEQEERVQSTRFDVSWTAWNRAELTCAWLSFAKYAALCVQLSVINTSSREQQKLGCSKDPISSGGICGWMWHIMICFRITIQNSPFCDAEYTPLLFFLQELQHSQDATQLMIGWFFPEWWDQKISSQHQVIVWSSRDAGGIVFLHAFVAIHTVWNDPWLSILPSPFTEATLGDMKALWREVARLQQA